MPVSRPGLGAQGAPASLSAAVVDSVGDKDKAAADPSLVDQSYVEEPNSKRTKTEDALAKAKANAIATVDAAGSASTAWIPLNVIDIIQVEEIQKDTGATLEIAKNPESGRPLERRVTITGTPEAQAKAVTQVQAVAAQSEDFDDKDQTLHLDIPACAAGHVIGKKGASIKAISHDSSARVQIAGEVNMDNPELKRVSISGGKAQRERACEMVRNCVQDYAERHNRGTVAEIRVLEFQANFSATQGDGPSGTAMMPTGDGQQTMKFLIPAACSGGFIGKAGVNIAGLRASGCHVNLAKDSDFSFPNDRVLTLTGSSAEIKKAAELIAELQTKLKADNVAVGLGFRPMPNISAPVQMSRGMKRPMQSMQSHIPPPAMGARSPRGGLYGGLSSLGSSPGLAPQLMQLPGTGGMGGLGAMIPQGMPQQQQLLVPAALQPVGMPTGLQQPLMGLGHMNQLTQLRMQQPVRRF